MEAWLISSGIDADMGGIASVTRSCLAALRGDRAASSEDKTKPCPRIARLIRVRDPESGGGPDPALSASEALCGNLEIRNCGGRRWKCLAEIAGQMLERPGLLIFEHVDLAQCQTMIPRALRRPYVVWGHGIELWRPLPPRKTRGLREADLLLFNSAFTRNKAASFHPWILDRPWRVVPLCREGSRLASSAPSGGAGPARKPWILTVGRLHEDRPKGHREILAGLPGLLRRVPDLHWHIVGSGPWRETLETMAGASPVRDRVTLHGFLETEALELLYRQCRVFAMPSQNEGFGLVYAEAMAHGLPCVGSTLDAATEVIGDAGACVDPANTDLLVEALAGYLLATPGEFQRFSELAGERATLFEIKRFAADLETALGELSSKT